MIPWGTNGFAVRVSSSRFAIITTPLISTGAATDLRVSLTAPTLPIPAGSNYTYTLVVTNAGPNSAVNVALAQTFPTNASYITSVASSGSSILGIGLLSSGNGLVTFFGSIASGSSRTVTVTMHSLKPGLLASVASVSSNAKDSNPSNNVVRIQLPVGSGLFPDRVVELALPSADLAWDKFSGRIFASVPNADWLLGNGILALNPTNGNFDPRIPTDLEPYKLAVADNGQYLYAGINGDISVQRVNIASRTVDLKFPTGFNNVADMAVLPATPHSIAVTAHTTFAVYDDGVRRTNVVAPGPYNFEYYLAVSDTNTLAYAGLPDELRRIAINASGATLAESTSLISGFDRFIRFDAGRLYTAGGRVIDPVSKVVVTNLPYGGLVCPDSQKARVFYLTVSGTTGTLHGINISNFSERGTVTVTNVLGGATSLIRWGLDGLAFRTSANQLFLIRTTLADDVDDDGMADTWETANFGSTNAATGHAGDDPDHDGMNNLAEFIAGTSPNDSNSVLRITSSSRQTNGVLLNWKGGTNMNHFVQRTQSLNGAPVWQDIYTNPPSAVSTNSFLDTSASNNSANFYRIRVTGQ
jgi:uncharacterized repeat protein (TIGR01451 family)